MSGASLRRLLAPIVDLRDEESVTVLLMFGYSFLAMSGYNVLKPTTRSKFIDDLGANNLPYVQLAAGLLMGFVIQGYTRTMRLLPRRWVFPATQLTMAAFLVLFWVLFRTGQSWVSVAYYFWGLLAGSLLISQFWTLANDIYDPRQAKRTFGFIGGGSSLGGIVGAGLAGALAKPLGTENLLLVGAAFLVICFFVVWAIVNREQPADAEADAKAEATRDMSAAEGLRLLLNSRHLQIIALVISFAAIGAGIIEQQLNMAAGTLIPLKDARTAFIANVIFYSSIVGFIFQMTLTARMHRVLGIGFALLILPVSLGTTAIIMLLNPVLWATTLARVSDTALRYTADKTTREILFMPLPADVKYKAKPFADVAVDRFAKGAGAALALLIAIKVFHLTWWQLSYLSLPISALWIVLALLARREYQKMFRQSIARQDLEIDAVRVHVADLSTIETLVEELANSDETRVMYAIDLLETLGKPNLVTPLLLHHESARVRGRALQAMERVAPELGDRWLTAVERALTDPDYEVRTAAVRALAVLRRERAAELMRPYLQDNDPRLVITAAIALAGSPDEADVAATEKALRALTDDTREEAAATRREVARAMPSIRDVRLHQSLVPLFYDPDISVALEAIRSAGVIGASDALFVPPLVSLLRHRMLKAAARDVLVGYGEPIVQVMGHFLKDREEDPWVRRHIPATLARIPSQAAADLLAAALDDPDGFLRFKALSALEAVVRERPDIRVDRATLEAQASRQAMLFFQYFSLRDSLRKGDAQAEGTLLVRAVDEKIERTKDRVYRFLGLMYGWKDIAGARWALERGDARARASAAEFLDNLLKGELRKRVMIVIEEIPYDERVRRANVMIRSRPRDVEDTVAQLIADEDQAVASAAIHYVEARRLDGLEGDLEHALAHRDVRDFGVFEAASWALASWRMPTEDRRAKWLEALPAVEVASRLRGVPLFESVTVDELFRIAAIGKQVRYKAGQRASDGAGRTSFEFLLDGRVITRATTDTEADGEGVEIVAPAVIGLETVLEEMPPPISITALEPTIALTIAAEDFLTLLSNNSQLAEGLFRSEMRRSGATKPVLPPVVPFKSAPRPAALLPVERALVLQNVPIFARAGSDQLLALAAIAKEVPLTPGVDLFSPGEPAAVYTVIAGRLQLQRDDGPAVSAGSGDTIGVVETLAGGVTDLRAKAAEQGSALRIDRDALFNLLSDRVDVLRDVFGAIRQQPAP